jgi:hypothetical protein
MKPQTFRKVKPDTASDMVSAIARLKNWQIFALALPKSAPAEAVIYVVASLPFLSHKTHVPFPQSEKVPAMQSE